MIKNRILILFFFSVCCSSYCQKDTIQLIEPTGKYTVGTAIYEWIDSARTMQVSPDYRQNRVILTQFWYPAIRDQETKRAPYHALSSEYQKTVTNSFLRTAIHTEISQAPLILIVPGRGTERFLYSTIAEELASHGFIVAAVDMPEIGYVTYQDGYTILPSKKFKTPRGMMAGPYEKVDAFFEEPTKLGTQDLFFVFDKIKTLNSRVFENRIDLNTVGLFGHSLGGRIAGQFAYENKSVKAYSSMEGIAPRKIRYNGLLKIPIAMLCSSGTWPYAKENYFSLIDNRAAPVFMIELPKFGHNSVIDNAYLFPENYRYEIDPKKGLEISRQIIRDYFESVLKKSFSFEEKLKDISDIKFASYD